jgi:hypothetical protein
LTQRTSFAAAMLLCDTLRIVGLLDIDARDIAALSADSVTDIPNITIIKNPANILFNIPNSINYDNYIILEKNQQL